MMRAVIFDVENSSRVEHIARMLEHLGLGTLFGPYYNATARLSAAPPGARTTPARRRG